MKRIVLGSPAAQSLDTRSAECKGHDSRDRLAVGTPSLQGPPSVYYCKQLVDTTRCRVKDSIVSISGPCVYLWDVSAYTCGMRHSLLGRVNLLGAGPRWQFGICRSGPNLATRIHPRSREGDDDARWCCYKVMMLRGDGVIVTDSPMHFTTENTAAISSAAEVAHVAFAHP